MELVAEASMYRNPIIDADVPDPDAIRVGDRFYLVASSFHRAPGLPIFASNDLVTWERIGYALERNEPAAWFALPRHGGGVWAPSIRHHDGRFVVVYPDPDQGVFVVTAEDAAGPWSAPHLLLPGLGIIDPCPLWDDDGAAYLVHGWARSRAGRKNVLTVVPVDAGLRHPAGSAVDVIDGDALEGFTTLEGPKFYKRDGAYWIFAPAGGVATGWQTVFRSDTPYGPYEHRVVLAQGESPVNGPHQGAWVDDGAGGDWFLHFQDRGVYGRVLHLQPMAWGDDGWPLMGAAVDGGPAQPVLAHRSPRGRLQGARTLARSDDFAQGRPGIHWQWEADPDPGVVLGTGPGLALRGGCDGGSIRTLPTVLSQALPGQPCTAAVDITWDAAAPGGRAGLAVLGRAYAWAGLRRTAEGVEAVVAVRGADEQHERVVAAVPLSEPRVHVAVAVDAQARVRVQLTTAQGIIDVDPGFHAVEGHWVGASLSLFAAGRYGAEETIARFERFTVDVRNE
ncbi:glycosyl hydrolase 43 family protein [Microbacterium protaetiae]|uniref:Glycosyl hydrolase 43 family protein n=1 Tax=Microbacterium protaetiae TaxID=2509458 RepID=A0A4P6EAT0_9MICO|nr:glycoside hydrolase 43 family protein [Microbacterium protaetiae]QAY59084.1 glycosyl hydrolase 43 family protein [Microbacterium protaetiae]